MDTIQAMIADYKKAGKTEWPVYLEAAGQVPWKAIVHVMDLCKARQLDPVEFDYENPRLLETIPRPRDVKRLPPPRDD